MTDAAQPQEGQTGQQDATQAAQDAPQRVEWEQWLTEQPEPVKTAYSEHVNGLKNALTAERTERKQLADQLKKMSKTAEDGSELQTQLQAAVGRIEEAESKADFYEDAHAARVTNLHAAWLIARNADLIDKRTGRVDMARLRTLVPEFFETRRAAPPANAGVSAAQAAPPPHDMNDLIRGKTGRG